MASKIVNVAQKVGDMTVMTTSIATREAYITMVLKGEEVWDIDLAATVEEARAVHEKFLLMCQLYGAVEQRHNAGETLDVEETAQELAKQYAMAGGARPRLLN